MVLREPAMPLKKIDADSCTPHHRHARLELLRTASTKCGQLGARISSCRLLIIQPLHTPWASCPALEERWQSHHGRGLLNTSTDLAQLLRQHPVRRHKRSARRLSVFERVQTDASAEDVVMCTSMALKPARSRAAPFLPTAHLVHAVRQQYAHSRPDIRRTDVFIDVEAKFDR
jgi:hypothetical protein